MGANFDVVYRGDPGITWQRGKNRFKVGYYQMRDILRPRDFEFQFQVRLDSKMEGLKKYVMTILETGDSIKALIR